MQKVVSYRYKEYVGTKCKVAYACQKKPITVSIKYCFLFKHSGYDDVDMRIPENNNI